MQGCVRWASRTASRLSPSNQRRRTCWSIRRGNWRRSFVEEGSVLSSQFSVLSSQFSVLSSQFSVLSSQFSVLSSQFSVLGSRVSGLGSQFSIARSSWLVARGPSANIDDAPLQGVRADRAPELHFL